LVWIAVLRALEANPKVATLTLKNQLEELLAIAASESGMRTVFIIDALDECGDEGSTSIMLKFFITSRSETHIRAGFRKEGLKLVTNEMVLHEIAAHSVDGDISRRSFIG
jgi:hypothetical protein